MNLDFIAKEMAKGRIVIFPTETVYGIGTNALDEQACKRIFQIKGRIQSNPLIVLISNFEMLSNISNKISQVENRLMAEFWPGPLTIVLDKKTECRIPDIVTAKKDNIGIRMTSGKVAKELIEKAGVPIVAPSANLSGKPTGVKIEEIRKDLGDKVDYILDYGDIENREVSTVVRVENEKINILRQGAISREELQKIAEIV